MKEEMKWITLWIYANTVMATLSLIYLYLNHEFQMYGTMTLTAFLLMIALPYCGWKYNQTKFVEKNNIVIQILKD